MATYSRFGGGGGFGRQTLQFGGFVPPMIKRLLILNTAIFVVYFFATAFRWDMLLEVFKAFSLIPSWVVKGAFWQPFSYLFLHSPYGFTHILFNMLMLWMFGQDLERDWGGRRFLEFYFFCGVGAGLCDVAARVFFGGMDVPTIGNSGAVYGILLAFGLLYPDRTVLFALIFPIPARVFVAIIGGIQFMMTFGSTQSNVSHVAHLGGMAFAYLYMRMFGSRQRRYKPSLQSRLRDAWKEYKLARARRKFQVYMKKRDGGQIH
jgi:membrane associated rhomboid family serine protease